MVFRALETIERLSETEVANSVKGAEVIPLHNIDNCASTKFSESVLLSPKTCAELIGDFKRLTLFFRMS
jgi:hypothetical protein